MKVSGITTFARKGQNEMPTDEVTLISDGNEVIGAFVPAAIWFQIQAFVGRVIERI